jgi:hypothetical protein
MCPILFGNHHTDVGEIGDQILHQTFAVFALCDKETVTLSIGK